MKDLTCMTTTILLALFEGLSVPDLVEIQKGNAGVSVDLEMVE